jgi:hypothetical protein
MSKPISYNAVTNICIRLIEFFAPEESDKEENYDFEAQDELRIVVESWLRQNRIPFEEK